MTLQTAIKPLMRDGKRVVLSEADYKLLESSYRKQCIATELDNADQIVENKKQIRIVRMYHASQDYENKL